MKNLYFQVTAIVIGLCFMGKTTNLSRKSNIFLSSECQWDRYLLANRSTGHTPQTADTADISFCFCSVLFQSYTKKEWKIKHLSLSNNLISKMTLSSFAYLHLLEILNLSNNGMRSLSVDLPLPPSSGRKHHRTNFYNGFPHLKVLILQRNRLSGTPKGLWKLKSLQSLDLSFNGILQIEFSDFQSCLKLENIYLKSNKIFKIHPEAFKDLKKLQVVDLSGNALTTLLPVVNMALQFPHLELDLTDNQWRCEDSIVDLQNFTSESWREKWDVICNKSVGNKEPHLETPKIRIPRDTHLPPTTLSHIQSKAERHHEGMDTHFSTLGKEAWAGYNNLREMRPQWATELRNPRAEQATNRKDDDSSNLTLAICLSVLITFVVAFCLGAFARPYVDTLWQQRCLNENPGSGNAYSNESFYDEIDAARSTQEHQAIDLHQVSHHPNLHENQNNASWVTECPNTTVIPEKALRNSRTDPGSQQSSVQYEDNIGAGSRDDAMLQNGQLAHSTLHRHPNANNHKLISTVLDHTYDILEELNYDTVDREYSLHAGSMNGFSIAGPLGTVSSSTHNEWGELELSHSREASASLSKTLAHTNEQGVGGSEERGWPEQSPLETMGSQTERQASNTISWLSTQQPRFHGASAEEGLSALYSEVPDVDPPALLSRWCSGSDVSPATKEPGMRDIPFDPHYNLETNYCESDSDEGSLFTFSSEGSEDTRSLTEEQAPGKNIGAHQTLHVRTSGDYKDNVTSAESVEAITLERTLEKYETQEDHSGNPLISGSDSGLHETQLEIMSNTSESQNPLTRPRSPDCRPLHPETPDTFVCDYDIMLQSQAVDCHCSLKDLEFPNVGTSPPSSAHSAEDPSDPEEPSTKEM
uniref:Leucine rich repeat containing 66 n=1 Tax=Nannospalax galili TaxID=1026970 RepID=A0A8C6W3W2_NANGA